jgi:hypothetical protein
LPEITEADLEAKPTGGGFPDWNEGATSVVVVFKNFATDYGDDGARYNAPANRENTITAEPTRQERPFVHDAQQAAVIAAAIATDPSAADISTNLTVLKSRCASLMPGDLLNWDYGPHALDLVCRVTERRIRFAAASDVLTLNRERGAYPRPYVAPVDDRLLPADDLPYDISTADVRLWFLPTGFGPTRQVAPLVNRTKRTIYRVDLHLSPTGSAPWEDILDCRTFAAKVAVGGSGIGTGDATVRVTTTAVDFARMAAQTTIGQTDDTLLLLLGDELLSVGTITAVSTGVYDLSILRGRRDTTAASHAVAVVGWLFYRSELTAVEHAEFYRVRDMSDVYDATIATKYFKLQLFTLKGDGNPKPDDPGISLVLPDLASDSTQGYTVVLSTYAHTVASAADGTVGGGELGAGGTAKTKVQVYRGDIALTAVSSGPNSDQFSISGGTVVGGTFYKESNDTMRCDAMATDTATLQILVNVGGTLAITKLFTVTKSKTGLAGSAGATGAPGPGIQYQGVFDASKAYYQTSVRRDIVSVGSNYYVTNNAAKSGTTTWGTPGSSGDWDGPYTSYRFVATAMLLAEDATILKTLVMGDGTTANAGIIRSAGASAFGTGAGFWLGIVGTTAQFRVGDPAAARLAWDGTALTLGGFTVTTTNLTAGSGATKVTLETSGSYLLFGNIGTTQSAVYEGDGLAVANGANAQIGLSVVSGAGRLKLYNGSGTLKVDADGLTGNLAIGGTLSANGGSLGLNGSSRFEFGSSGTNSIALTTNGNQRWLIGGSDGHLKVNGAYDIRKASGDGWTPMLFDNTNDIEFQVSGGHLYYRANGGSATLIV